MVLAARQARVVTKFCFDFSSSCHEDHCAQADHPGLMEFNIRSARRTDGLAWAPPSQSSDVAPGSKPADQLLFAKRGVTRTDGGEVFIALLDDEYFSFPEVSQVWGEANCSDVLKAAKRHFPLQWHQAASEIGEHIVSPLAEKVRPRWWYIAFVSCSDYGVEFSYDMHLVNQQLGWEREFSMDAVGVLETTILIVAVLGGLLAIQTASLMEWRARNSSSRWIELHPALMLVTLALSMALMGEVSWLAYYWYFLERGEGSMIYDVVARGSIISAKTVMQILFMLQAEGQCITCPDVTWADHQELIWGQISCGVLAFMLEVWSDTEFWSTSTEYVYDTRPGIALVAFDCLWLWMYATRCFQTFRAETRIQPRNFYKRYSPIFAIWFASLPLIALLGRSLAAWVRFRITFAVSGLVHAATLAVLIHTFRPSVAARLYDLKLSEYEPVSRSEELNRILGAVEDDDML